MERKNLTAKMLAAKAGISVNTLNMYISYREAIPSAEIAVKLARALGVTVEYLMGGPPPPHAAHLRESDSDLVFDSGKKVGLSTFELIVGEVKKTPKEKLPYLLEIVIKFNSENGAP